MKGWEGRRSGFSAVLAEGFGGSEGGVVLLEGVGVVSAIFDLAFRNVEGYNLRFFVGFEERRFVLGW
jgi:hypothetical protein